MIKGTNHEYECLDTRKTSNQSKYFIINRKHSPYWISAWNYKGCSPKYEIVAHVSIEMLWRRILPI